MTDGRIQVLHVDDDSEFAELAATLLKREDTQLEVHTEGCAVDGLNRLRLGDIDCIISDYQMPEKDGLEFLRLVRKTYPNLPFILFTGRGSEEIASEAITAGVDDYIQKFGKGEQYTLLVNRIRNLVDKSVAQNELLLKNQAMDAAPFGIILTDPSREDNPITYINEVLSRYFNSSGNAISFAIRTHIGRLLRMIVLQALRPWL